MTLDELRQKYPDLYQGKNDAEMVYTLSQVTGASPVRVAYDMGLDPSGFAQNEGTMDDLGTSLELGYEQTKRGLANLPNLPYALATGENLYETPEMDNEVARIQGTFSPGYQAAQREIGSAWDEGRYGDYALGLITNPGYTGNQLMQSGAPMVAGGIVGAGIRGVTALGALGSGMLARGAATAAPYIGEAVPSAAIQYKDLLDKDVDPRTAALTGLATGVGVGATAGLGGYLAGKAGYMDPEKFLSGMTRKVGDDTVPLSYKGQIGYGMLAEGAEEAVQSPWEEAMANVAQGKPWDEGLGRAAIEGGIAGGIIGGGFNALAPPLRRITPDQPADLLQDEQQADPAQPGVNPPGDRTTNVDPLAVERQRQIDAIMGGETYQTIKPGQADPGSLQGLTREQVNQRLIDAAMGGETARTFAPGQYPSDVAADLSQQQVKVNATRAAEQAQKAVEKQYEKAGWQKTSEKIALLETAQAPKLVSGIYGDEARKFVDSVLTMDAKTAGELFTNLSSSTAKSAPWKAAIAKAHLTNLAQQEAQTLAQQAKQNATIDGPGVPATPTVAQNAQPVEGAVPPAPTTSSVVQPDGVKAVPEGGTPPVVPVPPPSPTTPETPTNALSGQTTPQAGQETGTTPPDATTEPGVTEAPKVPQPRQKLAINEEDPDSQGVFDSALEQVAAKRRIPEQARRPLADLLQRYFQLGKYNEYSGVKPPSYTTMAAVLSGNGYPISHPTAGAIINEFQASYADAMARLGKPVTYRDPDAFEWNGVISSGNFRGKQGVGTTTGPEEQSAEHGFQRDELLDAEQVEREDDSTVPSNEGPDPEAYDDNAPPINAIGEQEATEEDFIDDAELGYQQGFVGNKADAAAGGIGGAAAVSARPRAVKFFTDRHLYAVNKYREARGEPPVTSKEVKDELRGLSDEVLSRHFDRLTKARITSRRLADPQDPKTPLVEAYQALQDDIAALGKGALRGSKNNRTVIELENPDVAGGVPGAVAEWQRATQNIPNAPTLGALDPGAAVLWEQAYNVALTLSDQARTLALRKVARKVIHAHNTRTKPEGTAGTAAQPGESDAVGAGRSQDNAGSVSEGGDTQPELAGRGSAAPEPDIVIGNRDASGVAVTTKKKRRVAPPAEPQVQQGLGEDVAATNPTTEQTLRDTIASLLGKGHNWRIHVYATPEEAHAAGHTPRKVGNAYGWVEADQKGVKHAYFIVNRIEQGTELGKFLHEVGAHIGLENILSEKEYAFLHDKILDWFVAGEAGDISIEAQAALSAAKRVKQAKKDRERAGGIYPRAEEMSELIAYFVEEAVNTYGVNPTAGKISGRLAEWFRKLITAFKRALRKLRIGNLDALTPQDVVDLAYGAARLSLVERKNAAPQRVTEAMPTQYGVDVPSHASAISEAVQNQLSKGGTGVKSNLLGWLRLDQLAEQYGKQLPMVAELNKLFNQMSAKAKHWLNRADHVIRMWDMLTPKQKELMHWIMGNATVEGYDPDDSKTTAKNDQQRLLDQKWKQLQALDAANPKIKAATVYRAARKHYQDDMQEAIDYLNGLKTQAKGANDKQLDSMITTLKALTKKSKGVYFPLMRFGDFYTVGMSSQLHALHQKRKALLDKGQALDEAEEKLYQKLRKDEKHYQVTGHDSERQARKHADKLRAQGMQATSNVGRYSQDAVRNTLSKDMDSFNKLLAELEVPKGVASRLQTAYESLLIDALPEGHTLKRQMDRDGIAGWDTDMRRVFAKSTQSRAFALSRLINMRQVQEQMAQLKRAGESFEPNAQLASPLYNELMARQELAYTRSEDPWWTRTATTWNYLTMLSFSPAFWLLNLSQVPVVTLPWLAARNGNQYRATMTGLAKAAGQTAKLIKWSIEGNEWRAELDTTRAIPGISQDEKQLLLDMQDAGKLEFTIGQDIGAVADGKSDFWAKLTRSINTPTHATELINRASTALTAYRISRKNGNDHAKAVEFAIRASDTTHVNYDPVVGARNMQTVFGSAPLAKIVFQFWKFQQGMAYLALSTMKDAWNHPDPAIKKQARDTAIGMTLTLTSTAGAFGLPFVGSALGLLTLAFGFDGDDDEDDNAERMLKNWMHDYLPGPVEDYLTKGIWGWFDGPDPSARFSMGGLMNPLAFARFDDTERGEDTLKEIMFRVFGGATGASAAAIWDGISAVGDGDYTKAGEKLLPLKFLRDLAKTVTLNTEGLATGKGEQRLDPNDFSVADSIWQAMGIQPAKKTNYYDRQGAIQAQKQAVEGTRDKLLAEYGQARLQGKDVSPIVVKITRFNQRNPPARIKAENLRQAVDRRKTNRRETDATGMLVNKQTRPYLPNARWTE